MNYTRIFVLLTLFVSTCSQSCIDPLNSQIVFPRVGSTLAIKRPTIVGVVTNARHKPIKNKSVIIYKNGRPVDTATTNEYGVWSIRIRPTQSLADGFYALQACIKTSRNTSQWMKGTVFSIDSMCICNQFYKSCTGAVDEDNSSFLFPFEGSFINTTHPIIIGMLLDTNNNPVVGETVILSLDGKVLINVTSDNNGIFSFMVDHALVNGNYTLEAHCVESHIDLVPVTFTIDTSTPDAPVITHPQQDELIRTGLVSLEGTAPAFAMVTTFMDNDLYGVITYALQSGYWKVDYELEDGIHSVTAQAESLSGNMSPLSLPRVFEVNEISS